MWTEFSWLYTLAISWTGKWIFGLHRFLLILWPSEQLSAFQGLCCMHLINWLAVSFSLTKNKQISIKIRNHETLYWISQTYHRDPKSTSILLRRQALVRARTATTKNINSRKNTDSPTSGRESLVCWKESHSASLKRKPSLLFPSFSLIFSSCVYWLVKLV